MSKETIKTRSCGFRLRDRILILMSTPFLYIFFRLAYAITHHKDDRSLYENFKYLFKVALKGKY